MMRRISMGLLLLATAGMSVGCAVKIIGGGSGEGGSDPSMTTGGDYTTTSTYGGYGGYGGVGGAGGAPTGDGTAIAMLASQVPPPNYGTNPGSTVAVAVSATATGTGTGTGTSTGSGGSDANTLEIFLSNRSLLCSAPSANEFGCGAPSYEVTIRLPPELQTPGTYPLMNHATVSASEGGGGDNCGGGGGTYWDGTIEVLSSDATQIVFTLSGTMSLSIFSSGIQGSADGTYIAKRCF